MFAHNNEEIDFFSIDVDGNDYYLFENLNNFIQFLDEPVNKSMCLRPTNSHEILEIVRSLKSSNST